MGEPTTRPPETPTKHGERSADTNVRWIGELPTKRMMRALLGVEAASFLLAALIHAGVLVPGYAHQEASIAESVIAVVLVSGVAISGARPHSTFSIAAGAQAFALFGTLVGIFTIIVGVGPRTVPDIVYHLAIVVVLVVGLRSAWRARRTDSP